MGDALTRLADAVEAGTATEADFDAAWPHAMNGEHHYAKTAYHGSLDAAKALHEAVLPEWWFAIQPTGATVGKMERTHDGNVFDGANQNPARAWLLAILRALAQVKK